MAVSTNNFFNSMEDTINLLKMHETLTGVTKGRRRGVDILNRSAIVLTTACWEVFVEDIADESLDFIISNINDPQKLPVSIKKQVANSIKNNPNELKAWSLAGDSWKSEIRLSAIEVKKKYTFNLNTPRPKNINNIFKEMLGIEDISACWCWKNISADQAVIKLERYVTLRGEIAHRALTAKTVTKADADDYAAFVMRLALKTNNKIRSYLHELTGDYPWNIKRAGSFK